MDAWDVLYANGGSTNKDAWDLLHSVHVVENNSPIYVKIEDKTSATVTVSENAKVVTVKGGSTPHISVSYTGGRGPIWLPGNTYDGTSLAAILAGYIGKAQLAQDLLADIDSTITGLVDARAELASAIQANIENGTRIDDVVSRITQAEDTLELSVAKLNAAEANISNAQVFIDDASVRLSAAEGSISNASNYIATQETILSNEWTVKIQENSDGTACVAGTGLLVYPTWKLDTVYDIDDYSWFDGNAYKAVIAHTASEENVPPNSSYWQLIPYATKSQFGVLAESFFVQTGTGEKAIPFIVQDDQVMINGDLTVNGLIEAGALSSNKVWSWSIQSQNYVAGTSGYSINALTGHTEFNDMDLTINYSSIVDAPDPDTIVQTAIDNTVDTTTGGLIVRDSSLQRYAHLTGGDITFYDLVDGTWHIAKAISKVITGNCVDGAVVNLGYFRDTPKITLSPSSMPIYNSTYSTQSQSLRLNVTNLTQVNAHWLMTVECKLVLASGTSTLGNQGIIQNSLSNGVTLTTSTYNYTNMTQIVVNYTLSRGYLVWVGANDVYANLITTIVLQGMINSVWTTLTTQVLSTVKSYIASGYTATPHIYNGTISGSGANISAFRMVITTQMTTVAMASTFSNQINNISFNISYATITTGASTISSTGMVNFIAMG